MAEVMGEQLEPHIRHLFAKWGESRKSGAFEKRIKHRHERRKAKRDPECCPRYRRYVGWEY